MPRAVASIPFARNSDPPVRGALHRADGARTLVLAHGAGGNHETPLLVTLARAFAADGVTVLRCALPFRQARASGPPRPADAQRDRRGLAAALDAVAEGAGPHLVGGHSYGGRQASMLLAEQPTRAHGLLLLSYPLHPPAKPERRRIDHLPGVRVPTLFVHGTRDPFGTRDEVATYKLSKAIRILWLEDGDHDLRPRKAASGFSMADHLKTMAEATAAWAESVIPTGAERSEA